MTTHKRWTGGRREKYGAGGGVGAHWRGRAERSGPFVPHNVPETIGVNLFWI